MCFSMKPDYALIPLLERLGINSLRMHQHKPVKSLMNGNDTLVIAGTASGKSLIYQLPALLHEKSTDIGDRTNFVAYLRSGEVSARAWYISRLY